jgi:hypothetical protein
MRASLPRPIKIGEPPTALQARTGLFTPPGIFSRARLKKLRDLLVFISEVLVTPASQCVKVIETMMKNTKDKFLLEKKFEKDYDFPFDNILGHILLV